MDFKSLFTPLTNIDFCLYFYILSVFFFISLFFAVISFLYLALTKRQNASFYLLMVYAAAFHLVYYFQNRLLYSMCVKSV